MAPRRLSSYRFHHRSYSARISFWTRFPTTVIPLVTSSFFYHSHLRFFYFFLFFLFLSRGFLNRTEIVPRNRFWCWFVFKFWNFGWGRSKNFAKRFIKLLTFRQEIRIIRFLKFVFLKTFPKFPFSRSVKPILQVQITSKFVIDSSTRDQQVHRLVNPLLIVKVFEKLEILIFPSLSQPRDGCVSLRSYRNDAPSLSLSHPSPSFANTIIKRRYTRAPVPELTL